MEWPPASYLWVVFFALQLWVYGCFGCFYEEESALLELKSSINHPTGTPLPSWTVGTDCCTWERVTCSSTVERVIALDLSYTMKFQYLNASLLLPFEELQSLDISENSLLGFIDEEALNRWSRLSKLEELDLSSNHLKETILPFLGALKSLKKLEISSNDFKGPLPIKAIENLTSLRTIDFSRNDFEGPLPIKAIETLTSLRTIDFSSNEFNDSQSIQGFCKLKGLQRLDLSYNHFKGPISLCFSNLTSLQLLNLSNNGFSGMIPTSTFPIKVFSVAYNNLSGRTPDMKSQFSTFSESSYEGNPLLCGQPLRRNCISTAPISEAPEEDENKEDDNIVSFYGSFVGSYLVFLIGTIGVLYFTSQRRATCFLHIVDSWCAFRLYKLYRLCSWK